MSHSSRIVTNKHQNRSKVIFQQYLFNPDEPYTDLNNEKNILLQHQPAGFYKNIRRQIRRDADRLRKHYS